MVAFRAPIRDFDSVQQAEKLALMLLQIERELLGEGTFEPVVYVAPARVPVAPDGSDYVAADPGTMFSFLRNEVERDSGLDFFDAVVRLMANVKTPLLVYSVVRDGALWMILLHKFADHPRIWRARCYPNGAGGNVVDPAEQIPNNQTRAMLVDFELGKLGDVVVAYKEARKGLN